MQKRQGDFFPSTPRAQNTVNSGFKRSNFLILAAIKSGMDYVIRSIPPFATKSLN